MKFLFLAALVYLFINCALFSEQFRQTVAELCEGQPINTVVIDPLSCHSFYICNGSQEPAKADCPDDMWFNIETGSCDWPENVICHLFTSTTSTTTPSTTTTTTTRDPNIEDGVFCPENDDPNVLTFIPSRIECERYYICYHGKPMYMRCLDGFYWNQAIRKCDYPRNAQCELDPNPTEPICPRSDQPTIQPHPTECNLYIFCVNGVAEIQRCPMYFHFDYQQQQCLIRDKANCIVNKSDL